MVVPAFLPGAEPARVRRELALAALGAALAGRTDDVDAAAAARRVVGRTGSLVSRAVSARREAPAVFRAVAVDAFVQMLDMDESSDMSASGTDARDSDASESLHTDKDTCEARELLGFFSLDMCLVALPSSQLDTMEAKRRVHRVSCADDSMGEQLAIIRALPSPDRHGCSQPPNMPSCLVNIKKSPSRCMCVCVCMCVCKHTCNKKVVCMCVCKHTCNKKVSLELR